MDRLIATNSVAAGQADVAPVTGTPQFATSGNPVTGTPATTWPAYAFNAIQEELIAIIAAAGIATDRTNNGQVLAAIKSLLQTGGVSYAVATGTANAHLIALTPALTARVDGMVIRYRSPGVNTGALTLNDGLGVEAVFGPGNLPLQGGETMTNGDVWVQWSTSRGAYMMIASTGGSLQVAAPQQSNHAVSLGQFGGVMNGLGYKYFPDPNNPTKPTLIQWGYYACAAANTPYLVNYPISFSNAVLGIFGAYSNTANTVCSAFNIGGISLSTYRVVCATPDVVSWFAIGN